MPSISVDKEIRQANGLLKQVTINQAISVCNSVLKVYPSNSRALNGITAIKKTLADVTEKRNPAKFDVDRISELYRRSKYRECLTFSDRLIQSFPLSEWLHNISASCNLKLGDVVSYYALYKDLMRFWQEPYGDRMYHLNYDRLTMDQDLETRQLIHYLGLEWEKACLSPQDNKRSVQTASNVQVRDKVYQGSSQKWLKYKPFLNGAFDNLVN